MSYTTISELLAKAKDLKGKRVCDLFKGELNPGNKGNIGNIIESAGFGIENNNESRPDFEKLGVELKVLPLKRIGNRRLTVKERTKVCMINYRKLINEDWGSSHARSKLKSILFIFYEHVRSDVLRSPILDYHLFDLEKSDETMIRSDWERTRRMVEAGFAHTLSESQNVILAASRSGAGRLPESQWPEQPNQTYSANALQRAFSLKPSFTKTIWREVCERKPLDRIIDLRSYSDFDELEDHILSSLNAWEGHTMAEFSAAHGASSPKSKNSDASVIRSVLGFRGSAGEIKELLQAGLSVKTVPCRSSDLFPFESMSFPYQPLGELAEEERFDESDFYSYLQGFIFIPLMRPKRNVRSPDAVRFGRSVIWRPGHDELVAIQKEWELCRDIVRNGIVLSKKRTKGRRGFIRLNNLPGEADTEYIHMRPHARDSDDVDPTYDFRITKQSFWFNKSLIQRVIG